MTRSSIAVLALLVSCFFIQAAFAQTSIVRIEEDWQLAVTQPDEQLDAPQVTNTMIPFASNGDLLLQIDFNHASIPSFSKGGIQVRACTDDDCLAQVRLLNDQRLHQESETINWTQVVQLAESGFYFGIGVGSGPSWGDFGGEDAFIYVSQEDAGSSLSLENYDPQHSFENSGVTYAGNRVGHLRLKKVRVWNSQGIVSEWVFNQDIVL